MQFSLISLLKAIGVYLKVISLYESTELTIVDLRGKHVLQQNNGRIS